MIIRVCAREEIKIIQIMKENGYNIVANIKIKKQFHDIYIFVYKY